MDWHYTLTRTGYRDGFCTKTKSSAPCRRAFRRTTLSALTYIYYCCAPEDAPTIGNYTHLQRHFQSGQILLTPNEQKKPAVKDQLELAKAAASGEKNARQQVNTMVQPIIDFQTSRFCKRFCNENQYLYRCTLKPPMGAMHEDAAVCEWGNASFGWMLDDLSRAKRLLQYQGLNDASLFDYFYQIANSLPFYERWKDWRFGRKVHVPTYIKALAPDAARVFFGLRAGDDLELLAQKLSRPLNLVEQLAQSIVCLLTQKKRLHLLNPPKLVSMTESVDDSESDQEDRQIELASYDEPIEDAEDKQRLTQAWAKLDAVEQFVLEALLIDELDAEDVLAALRTMQMSIKKGVPADQTDRQQLYYFRRKTLARLAEAMHE
jgi:hypothetical protein